MTLRTLFSSLSLSLEPQINFNVDNIDPTQHTFLYLFYAIASSTNSPTSVKLWKKNNTQTNKHIYTDYDAHQHQTTHKNLNFKFQTTYKRNLKNKLWYIYFFSILASVALLHRIPKSINLMMKNMNWLSKIRERSFFLFLSLSIVAHICIYNNVCSGRTTNAYPTAEP